MHVNANHPSEFAFPHARVLVSGALMVVVPVRAEVTDDGLIKYQWYRLGKAVEIRGKKVPQLRIEPMRRVPGTLWRRFIRLDHADDETICSFALRYGPLTPRFGIIDSEPISYWRKFSRLGSALINGYEAVRVRRAGRDADWQAICDYTGYPETTFISSKPRKTDSEGDSALKFAAIAQAANKWFTESGPHSLVHVYRDGVVVAPRSETLLGALITQIMDTITQATSRAICSGCSHLYEPKVKPRDGRRRYCPACRKKRIPQRDAARDFRKKKRGHEPREIVT